MVKAQEWLDREYPNKEAREKITKLYLYEKTFEGFLDLSDFVNLIYLECPRNQITGLNLSKNSKLTLLGCYNNKIKKIDLSSCKELDQLYISVNLLEDLEFLENLPNPKKLLNLDLNTNNFYPQPLTVFSRFTNLKYFLNISSNRFYGGLKPLEDLKGFKNPIHQLLRD
jgi:hypothetical protein